MTPIQTFLDVSKKLASRPIDFWLLPEKQKTLKDIAGAILKLEKILETKKLTDTHAYKQLKALEKTVSPTELKEVAFIQLLIGLVDIYKHSPTNGKTNELIAFLDVAVARAKPKILEHHLSLEHLTVRAAKLTAEVQAKQDMETIQKIGIFYVLEYTLQVLFEFTRLKDVYKQKLLKEGLKTPAGNLPSYYPLEDTFRKELSYKIFDAKLRHSLLQAFYKLEEVLYSEDMAIVGRGLKEFNISLLQAFQAFGLKEFKGLVYAPFGNTIAIDALIKTIEKTVL